jgi:hypothetical protein
VKALILAWATTETQLGRSFEAITPPVNAVRGNALLAKGELTFGSELASATQHLPQRK